MFRTVYGKKESNNGLSLGALLLILFVLLLAALFFSIVIGRYGISMRNLTATFFPWLLDVNDGQDAAMLHTVVFSVRMPRLLAAVIIGGALSMSGAAYQGIFRNPMVSPDILGAAAGAGFGAAVGILLSFNYFWIQILSFVFGLVAVGVTYFISLRFGRSSNPTLVLVLTGIVVGTLFTSFISLTKYVADPYSKLPAITFWLMGSLSSVAMSDVAMLIFPVVLAGIPLMMLRWRLNVLSFGDEEARALGVDTSRLRLIIIICATMMTASSVSISGLVGWVGLVIPHLVRMITGPDHKAVLPVSVLIGGLYLLIVDNFARNAFAMEIPLGVLTSIIGAPFFIYLMMYGKKSWS
ncbi:MAG: FecCD family ABC transporter permease [Deferribacterales bacterium]